MLDSIPIARLGVFMLNGCRPIWENKRFGDSPLAHFCFLNRLLNFLKYCESLSIMGINHERFIASECADSLQIVFKFFHCASNNLESEFW